MLRLEDGWVFQIQWLNGTLREAFSDQRLGDRVQRRKLLEERVGPIRKMNRIGGDSLTRVLGGRPLVGVDGSVNSFGGGFPHYMDFIRALAKPTQGEPIVLEEIHCPLPPGNVPGEVDYLRDDYEVRQRKLAELEVKAALAAIVAFRPSIILIDGPLVRFDMRTKESFDILRESACGANALLAGCIENIESQVILAVLGDSAPEGWRNSYDRDLLWGVLEYGEVLEVRLPVKGTRPRGDGEWSTPPIRTCFMRSSLDPGVIGVDMLEEQVASMPGLVDYLFTLSPMDGRGIPIWLDLVDREVRLTRTELEAYLELLDPRLRRLFMSKRDGRVF